MSKPMKSIISLLALCSLPLIGDARDWHTPAAGSAERAQVMTALRGELAKYDPNAHDLRFVVRDLCVSNATGWIEADPQSANGENRYEPVSASLRKRNGRWVVGRLACSEEDCAAGTSPDAIRRRIDPICGQSSPH